MNFILTAVIVFGIIIITTKVLQTKPKKLVVLYFEIFGKPYPSNKSIMGSAQLLAIVAYIALLIYFIKINN